MNFLAHAYLSFNNADILTGNMISDFVKGKKQYDYPLMIQKGITLHRSIDQYTDAHPATKEINRFFHPVYRLYSGAFTDIVYDFFLANDTNEFASETILRNFTLQSYNNLNKNLSICPLRFQQVFPHMVLHNWLYNYRTVTGIMKSFAGMAFRAKYMNDAAAANMIFIDNIENMRPFYNTFFPMLKIHAAHTLKELINSD